MEKRRLWEQKTENVRMEPNADGKRFVCRGSRAGKLLGLAVLTASLLPLAPVYAVAPDAAVSDDQTDNAQAAAGDYSQVASDSEKVTPQEVGIPGMTPITADDVADGTYEVTVESSSSMSVSYTHLDVYKRQDKRIGMGAYLRHESEKKFQYR